MNNQNQESLFRRAVITDSEWFYECICDLENETLDRPEFERIFNDVINDDQKICIVFDHDGIRKGFITCYFQLLLHHNGLVAEIQELYVKQDFREHKIGTTLIHQAINESKQRGAVLIEVTTNLNRYRTHSFYEGNGFMFTHKKFTMNL